MITPMYPSYGPQFRQWKPHYGCLLFLLGQYVGYDQFRYEGDRWDYMIVQDGTTAEQAIKMPQSESPS